jgi:hypothetical protein
MISLEKKRMCFQTLGIQKVTELVYIVKLHEGDSWKNRSSPLKIPEKSNSGVAAQLEYWNNGILE